MAITRRQLSLATLNCRNCFRRLRAGSIDCRVEAVKGAVLHHSSQWPVPSDQLRGSSREWPVGVFHWCHSHSACKVFWLCTLSCVVIAICIVRCVVSVMCTDCHWLPVTRLPDKGRLGKWPLLKVGDPWRPRSSAMTQRQCHSLQASGPGPLVTRSQCSTHLTTDLARISARISG